jgi:ubiquinone/menaquinone biosynthesis C-methylase UbiE
MADAASGAGGEGSHDVVYGRTFARYSMREIEEFIEPFEIRFAENGLDADAVFGGARCLDAGCGGGRGTIFLGRHGAASVTSFDYSDTNVATTRANADRFGIDNVEVQQGTLVDLPFDDESFDVVWCNGVLQHADDPDACLREVTRVLRVGGTAWFYVYGAGGVYWYAIDRFRELLADVDAEACIALLELLRVENRYIAEYLDDWKVSNLRTYSRLDFTRRLAEVGFADPQLLPGGVSYDTNALLAKYPNDAPWLGEGDLRALVTKARHGAPQGDHPLSSTARGSDVAYAPEVLETFGLRFDELAGATAGSDVTLRVAAAARVQRRLRDLLSEGGEFPVEPFADELDRVIALVRDARRAP